MLRHPGEGRERGLGGGEGREGGWRRAWGKERGSIGGDWGDADVCAATVCPRDADGAGGRGVTAERQRASSHRQSLAAAITPGCTRYGLGDDEQGSIWGWTQAGRVDAGGS